LTSWFGVWSGQYQFILEIEIVVWLDLQNCSNSRCSSSKSRGLVLLALLFSLLGRVSWTALASDVVTRSTNLVPTENCVAPMTLTMDAHADWLLDAIDFLILGGELWRFDDHSEAFTQLAGSFGVNL
jgi:hypothetical protein